MITLTTPRSVNTVLGGSSTVSYDKFVITSINYDVVNKITNAAIVISSSTDATQTGIPGTLRIDNGAAVLEIQVSQLDFFRRVTLTGPQNTSATALITNAQNALESGLITIGVIAGVQSAGT